MNRNITVAIPYDVVYVTGTVNGVPVTYTYAGEHKWTAATDRNATDVYDLYIQAVDVGGNRTELSTVYYYGLHLITDRTEADVQRVCYLRNRIGSRTATAEEETEWEAGLKGAYNATDINRVECAMLYIAGRYNDEPVNMAGYIAAIGVAPDAIFTLPYIAPDLTIDTTWTQTRIPTAAEMVTYLTNIAAIRAVLPPPTGNPSTPADMAQLTYTDANAIEIILEAADIALTAEVLYRQGLADHTAAGWYFAGDLIAGEV